MNWTFFKTTLSVAVSALALGALSACSQNSLAPNPEPILTPQFGTALEDVSRLVLASKTSAASYVVTTTFSDVEGAYQDVILRQFSASGSSLWAKDISPEKIADPVGITEDSQGNIYVALTLGMQDWQPTGELVKYSSSGRLLWRKAIAADNPNVELSGVVAASDDTIFVLGSKRYGRIPFIAKYAANGNLLWINNSVPDSTDGSASMDAQNNLYFVDYETLYKYSAAGVKQWSRLLPKAGATNVLAQSATAKGNAVSVIYDKVYGAGDEFDVGIIKFSAAGNQLWNKTWGTPQLDIGRALTMDQTGNVYASSEQNGAYAVRKYAANGAVLWQRTFKSVTLDMDVQGSQYVYLGGTRNQATPTGDYEQPTLRKLTAAGSVVWFR